MQEITTCNIVISSIPIKEGLHTHAHTKCAGSKIKTWFGTDQRRLYLTTSLHYLIDRCKEGTSFSLSSSSPLNLALINAIKKNKKNKLWYRVESEPVKINPADKNKSRYKPTKVEYNKTIIMIIKFGRGVHVYYLYTVFISGSNIGECYRRCPKPQNRRIQYTTGVYPKLGSRWKKKKESRKETGYRLCYIFDSALQSKYLIVFFLFLLYMVFIFLFFIENFQVPTVSQFEQTESSWPTATSFSYGLLYSVGPLSFLLLQNSLKFTTVCMASISFTFHSAKDHVTEPVWRAQLSLVLVAFISSISCEYFYGPWKLNLKDYFQLKHIIHTRELYSHGGLSARFIHVYKHPNLG